MFTMCASNEKLLSHTREVIKYIISWSFLIHKTYNVNRIAFCFSPGLNTR